MGQGQRRRRKRKSKAKWLVVGISTSRKTTVTFENAAGSQRDVAFRLPDGVVGKVERDST